MTAPTSRSPRARAVLVAAGRATRMGSASVRKPFARLDERTVLEVAAAAFLDTPEVVEVVLVTHPEDVARAARMARELPVFAKVKAVVAGGEERTDSVRCGVRAGSAEVDVLAIHDAARPLITPEAIGRAVRAAHDAGAALVAVPVRDTVKSAPDGRWIERTLDRRPLWLAQTPQCFRCARFEEILDRAERDGFRPTDDAALWERYEGPVSLVEGESTNLKITTPKDLEIARALLAARAVPRRRP